MGDARSIDVVEVRDTRKHFIGNKNIFSRCDELANFFFKLMLIKASIVSVLKFIEGVIELCIRSREIDRIGYGWENEVLEEGRCRFVKTDVQKDFGHWGQNFLAKERRFVGIAASSTT
jgi:hypothetical protein